MLGHNTAITQATVPTQSQALELLYNDYLRPVIDRLPASTAVTKAFESEDVLLLIHEHLHDLTRVFCQYAEVQFDIEDIDGSRESGLMNLQQFILLVTDYDFLGPIIRREPSIGNHDGKSPTVDVSGKEDITLKDVRQVFSASQHDTAMNDAEIQLEDDSHKETMVFPEYIEAIIRLGFLKYSSVNANDHSDHYFECVRLAIGKIVSAN